MFQVLAPILSLNLFFLLVCMHRPYSHDAPQSGHQGVEKTLEWLRQEAYWVNMAQDMENHCRECSKYQQAKPPMPQRAPLTNIPIGHPWQMVAVDVLEDPVLTSGNRYLLVVQDYFTKWVGAIPILNQTAQCITIEGVSQGLLSSWST